MGYNYIWSFFSKIEIKLNYMPLLVMSDNFEKSWEEYNTVYNAAEPQIYFDALTDEVRRRCSIATGANE